MSKYILKLIAQSILNIALPLRILYKDCNKCNIMIIAFYHYLDSIIITLKVITYHFRRF